MATLFKILTVVVVSVVIVATRANNNANSTIESATTIKPDEDETATPATNAIDEDVTVQNDNETWEQETEFNDDLPLSTTEVNEKLPNELVSRLKRLLNCDDEQLRMRKTRYGSYWLLQNIVRGEVSQNIGCAESITWTTHGDYTHIKQLLPLVERWRAPISMAIFAPDNDILIALSIMQYVRYCCHESVLIRQYVSFHIYFPSKHVPRYVPVDENDIESWSYDCFDRVNPLDQIYAKDEKDLKRMQSIVYPTNIGRNIARQAVNTHFIFACDIGLFPSAGLPRQFLELIARNKHNYFTREHSKRVYPVPVFELQPKVNIPSNTEELYQLVDGKQATFVRTGCTGMGQQAAWLLLNTTKLSIAAVVRREHRFDYGKLYYISDNDVPMYDERVTWELVNNKRMQGYALCVLNYEYHILHPAFLVQTPAIKYLYSNSKPIYDMFSRKQRMEEAIEEQYTILYGHDSVCRI